MGWASSLPAVKLGLACAGFGGVNSRGDSFELRLTTLLAASLVVTVPRRARRIREVIFSLVGQSVGDQAKRVPDVRERERESREREKRVF